MHTGEILRNDWNLIFDKATGKQNIYFLPYSGGWLSVEVWCNSYNNFVPIIAWRIEVLLLTFNLNLA